MGAKPIVDACHHVAIVVRDAAEARAFYGDVLGLERLPRPAELEEKFPGAWFRLGSAELHLFEARDPQDLPRAGSAIGPHFALHTSDFDGTVAALRERGCDFAFGPGRDSEGTARVIVRDPSGNIVEITDAALGS